MKYFVDATVVFVACTLMGSLVPTVSDSITSLKEESVQITQPFIPSCEGHPSAGPTNYIDVSFYSAHCHWFFGVHNSDEWWERAIVPIDWSNGTQYS